MAEVNLNAAELEGSFRRALEAFNTADWTAFRDRVSPECVYEEIGTEERFEGADAYVERVKMWKAAMPDITGTIDSVTLTGQTLSAELRWKGTHTGTLETMAGPIPATGKSVDSRAVMVVESDASGRAVRVRHYTNPMLMMTQFGLMPAAEPARTQ